MNVTIYQVTELQATSNGLVTFWTCCKSITGVTQRNSHIVLHKTNLRSPINLPTMTEL